MPIPQEPTIPLEDPGPRRASKNRRLLSAFLFLAGVLVVAYPASTEAYGYFVQSQLNQAWDQELARQGQVAASVETRQVEKLGERVVASENTVLTQAVNTIRADESADFPATKVKIPKIGLEQVVLDDVDVDTLKRGPGHYRGTANPGQRGTVGIAGHRITYTHPFNRVDELAPGDKIILETLDNIFEYRVVRSDTLEPDDLSALVPRKDGRARLTLTTCTPKYSARFRLDVQASLARVTPRRKPAIWRNLVKNIAPLTPAKIPQNILELAMRQGQAGVADNPLSVTARLNLGVTYRNMGRLKDAAFQIGRAIELEPGNAAAHFELALVHTKLKKPDDAIKALERAIELEPEMESAYYRLGNLFLETKRPEEAVEALEVAASLIPFSGDTHYYLGRAYEGLGEPERAIEAYEKATRFVPDLVEAQTALKRLRLSR